MAKQSHKDIAKQLERYYHDVLGGDDAEEIISTLDPLDYLFKALVPVFAPGTTLHVCERNNQCTCKSPQRCLCDSDQFYTVTDCNHNVTSNHQILFHIRFDSSPGMPILKLNPRKNIRFFTLHTESDIETPVMDIIKLRKEKDVRITFPTQDKQLIHFHVPDRRVRVAKHSIDFALDYMMYDKIP